MWDSISKEAKNLNHVFEWQYIVGILDCRFVVQFFSYPQCRYIWLPAMPVFSCFWFRLICVALFGHNLVFMTMHHASPEATAYENMLVESSSILVSPPLMMCTNQGLRPCSHKMAPCCVFLICLFVSLLCWRYTPSWPNMMHRSTWRGLFGCMARLMHGSTRGSLFNCISILF